MIKRREKGICSICPAGCGVEITLENDRINKIHPWKDHPQGKPCNQLTGTSSAGTGLIREKA